MHNLTESSTYTSTVPIIDDGDPLSNASFQPTAQALANRSKFLNDAVNLLLAGAKNIYSYTDAASLRAVTTHVNGSSAVVVNVGFYVYSATSTRTDDGVLCIKPTDVGGGAGRWLNPAVFLLANDVIFGGDLHTHDLFCDALTASGVVECNAGLQVTGTTQCGNLDADATTCTTLTASGLVQCNAGIDCNGAIDVSGVSNLHGAVHCYSTLQADGKIDANGGIDIDASSTLTAPLSCSSTGRVRVRVVAAGATGTTYGANDADVVIATSLAADVNYTLTASGAQNGDVIQFVNFDTVHAMIIERPAGDIDVPLVGDNIVSAELTFFNGHWYFTMARQL